MLTPLRLCINLTLTLVVFSLRNGTAEYSANVHGTIGGGDVAAGAAMAAPLLLQIML